MSDDLYIAVGAAHACDMRANHHRAEAEAQWVLNSRIHSLTKVQLLLLLLLLLVSGQALVLTSKLPVVVNAR